MNKAVKNTVVQLLHSPMNYTGGKYKLLPQILPLFPEKIDRFVDLFCGGCNVAINVVDRAAKIICNDSLKPLIDMYKAFQKYSEKDIIRHVENRIETLNLVANDKSSYNKLRELYNRFGNPLDLFVCIRYSFCFMMRFNRNGKFNVPVGRGRYNEDIGQDLRAFINRISDIKFVNKDFRTLPYEVLGRNDLVYCDPPYLISTAMYNENGGWGIKDEKELYKFLDKIDSQGCKFALSNVIIHRERENEVLKQWIAKNKRKYTVHKLEADYSAASPALKERYAKTVEVLVVNY